jgi:hypothetical protein
MWKHRQTPLYPAPMWIPYASKRKSTYFANVAWARHGRGARVGKRFFLNYSSRSSDNSANRGQCGIPTARPPVPAGPEFFLLFGLKIPANSISNEQ